MLEKSVLDEKLVDLLYEILYKAREMYPGCKFMWKYHIEIGSLQFLVSPTEEKLRELSGGRDEEIFFEDIVEEELCFGKYQERVSNEFREWISIHDDDCEEIIEGVDIYHTIIKYSTYKYVKGQEPVVKEDVDLLEL